MPKRRNRHELPYEPLSRPRELLVGIYVGVALAYVVWRFGTLNLEAPIFSGLVYAAEIWGIITMFLLLFMCWRLTRPSAPAPPDGLTVDVLVPTYNEPVEVVRRTLLAAIRMDYPHQTWLLDDGDRREMADLAARLGCRYLARRHNTDAKAGNLNNALAHSTAAFVAVFDADHAPHRHFLVNTLGYFRNPNVAFVQTPQDFYNLDSYQHRFDHKKGRFWAEQSLFFNVLLPGKDYWNAAFFCGSCAVLRRSALDAVGGIATGSVTEDLHTSLRLHEKGYESVYHPRPLAFGIAALNATDFMRQRLRWGQGAMQVWRQEKVLLSRNLTLPQRLGYFASISTYFEGWQRAVFCAIPAYALVSGKLPINITVSQFLIYFVPYLALTFWTLGTVARGHGHPLYNEQYSLARFAVFCRSTLGYFRRRLPFMVTGKRHQGGGGRLAAMRPQLAVLGINVLAVPVGIVLYAQTGHLATDALVVNVFWAGVVIVIAASLLRFTWINSAQRRREYRFPVRVCAAIDSYGDVEKLVTVDNLSPAGFAFYGGLPGKCEKGQHLTGHLHLPSGAMRFNARIRAVHRDQGKGEDFIRTVRCEFEGLTEEATEHLEAFLHGNDLQWHFLGASENTGKPRSSLYDNPGVIPTIGNAADKHWACCTYLYPVQGDLRHFHGLVSASGSAPVGDRNLVVMQPLIYGGTILVRPETYDGQGVIAGDVAGESRLPTADGTVYLYRLENCKRTRAWVGEPVPA